MADIGLGFQGYPGPGAPYDEAVSRLIRSRNDSLLTSLQEVDDSVDSREYGLQGWTPGSK